MRTVRRWVSAAWTRGKAVNLRRAGEVTTVLAACLALVISLWTASASNDRADRSRVDDLRARLRDDMSKLGELDEDLRGTESDRSAASLQLGVWATEAWELINEIGPERVSPVDLALTAQSLALSGLHSDADRAIQLALRRTTSTDVRLVLLNSAFSVYYQSGDLTRLRAAAAEVLVIQAVRDKHHRADGNGYANLGATEVARVHFMWSYAEAAYRNCAIARDHYEQGLAISNAIVPPFPLLVAREQYAQGSLKQNCPAELRE